MKNYPYKEIFDLRKERKEYSRLCGGKSKKYRYYTDWEEHMLGCLSNIQAENGLTNFKKYCRNIERTSVRASDLIGTYIALLIPLIIDKMFKDIPGWLILVWFIIVTVYVLRTNKRMIREGYFYTDIIEIIEKMEAAINNESKQGET